MNLKTQEINSKNIGALQSIGALAPETGLLRIYGEKYRRQVHDVFLNAPDVCDK